MLLNSFILSFIHKIFSGFLLLLIYWVQIWLWVKRGAKSAREAWSITWFLFLGRKKYVVSSRKVKLSPVLNSKTTTTTPKHQSLFGIWCSRQWVRRRCLQQLNSSKFTWPDMWTREMGALWAVLKQTRVHSVCVYLTNALSGSLVERTAGLK